MKAKVREMKCEKCRGIGIKWGASPRETSVCEDCQGSGITHCCDGLCEQPQSMTGKDIQKITEYMREAPQVPTVTVDGEECYELYKPIDIRGEEEPNDHGC